MCMDEAIKNYITGEIVKFTEGKIPENELKEMIRKSKKNEYIYDIRKLNKYRIKLTIDDVKKWCEKMCPNELIESIINQDYIITFNRNREITMNNIIKEIMNKTDKYGMKINEKETQKLVLIEYSSPNIAKPFHMGHLRSTIIGNFMKNLYQAMNYKVVNINYLGDWGKQYGLLGVGYEKWGNDDILKENPVKHLYEIYVKANTELFNQRCEISLKHSNVIKLTTNVDDEGDDEMTKETNGERAAIDIEAQEYFRKMEMGSEKEMTMWHKLREMSINELTKMYERLGIKFDIYSGESMTNNKIGETISRVSSSKLSKKDEKGLYMDLESKGLGRASILKSDGTTLYLTRDIAEILRRKEMWPEFDRCYYVVGETQKHHFNQLKTIVKEIMDNDERYIHIGFGMVKGMKTRKGKAIFLSDFLDDAKDRMMEIMSENKEKYENIKDPEWTADQLGLSALVIWDMFRHRLDGYEYDWNKMSSFRGETGPYLQYAHARLMNLEEKVKNQIDVNVTCDKVDIKLIMNVDEAYELVKMMGEYPNILEECSQDNEPVHLVNYLMNIGKIIGRYYEVTKVKDEKNKLLAETRFIIFKCARIVLANGIRMLGLIPINNM